MRKVKIVEQGQTTYEIHSNGFPYLTIKGDKVDVFLLINAQSTFLKMGRDGFLRGKALELYKKILKENNP